MKEKFEVYYVFTIKKREIRLRRTMRIPYSFIDFSGFYVENYVTTKIFKQPLLKILYRFSEHVEAHITSLSAMSNGEEHNITIK